MFHLRHSRVGRTLCLVGGACLVWLSLGADWAQAASLRAALLAYCRQDTLAMVELVECLSTTGQLGAPAPCQNRDH